MSALPTHADFSPALRSDTTPIDVAADSLMTGAANAAPPPAFGTISPRAGDWLRAPVWANRGLFAQVALAAALINALSLATSLFSMAVYNKIIPNNATDSLAALLIGISLVLAFDFLLRILRGYFVDVAGQNIDHQLGSAVFDRLVNMKLSDRQGSNGAFAGLLREFESLREFFTSATIVALVDVPFILLFLLVIALVAPPLALVPLLAIPLVIAAALLAQPLLARIADASLAEGLNKQGIIVETIAGLETIKTSRAAPLLAARWRRAVAAHAALALRQRLAAGMAVHVAAVAQNIVYVAMLGIGVGLIAEQRLSMGALIAASMLSGRCVAPLGQIAMLLTRLGQTHSAWRALNRIMASPGETEGSPLRRAQLNGAITFENVGFTYPGSNTPALTGLSFHITPGERVAVIGRVGSGKSTIARLALGLYAPDCGAVRIDDADIRQLHPDDLRANIGAVLQDIVLLSGTIRDNIALGDAGISDAEVLHAARLSGAHDIIGRLPRGYDHVLADRGEGLSGGQRQMIAVARALVGNRSLLLFDEPTSALDFAGETALIDRLATALTGRTALFITHRQSLLRLATRIIILEAGQIVADGPRDAVLHRLTLSHGAHDQ
jgi:ATP-binding cassette subfamily C protein LapB